MAATGSTSAQRETKKSPPPCRGPCNSGNHNHLKHYQKKSRARREEKKPGAAARFLSAAQQEQIRALDGRASPSYREPPGQGQGPNPAAPGRAGGRARQIRSHPPRPFPPRFPPTATQPRRGGLDASSRTHAEAIRAQHVRSMAIPATHQVCAQNLRSLSRPRPARDTSTAASGATSASHGPPARSRLPRRSGPGRDVT